MQRKRVVINTISNGMGNTAALKRRKGTSANSGADYGRENLVITKEGLDQPCTRNRRRGTSKYTKMLIDKGDGIGTTDESFVQVAGDTMCILFA